MNLFRHIQFDLLQLSDEISQDSMVTVFFIHEIKSTDQKKIILDSGSRFMRSY